LLAQALPTLRVCALFSQTVRRFQEQDRNLPLVDAPIHITLLRFFLIEHSDVIERACASAIDILNPLARHAFIRSVVASTPANVGLSKC